MLYYPKKIVSIRSNSYFRKISQYNSNKIIEYFKIFYLSKCFLNKRIKKFLLESNSNNESYFIFITKYLTFLFQFKQLIVYIKSEKEISLSMNNKDKIGIELIIGSSYFFLKKKNPYVYLNLNCDSNESRILSIKIKEFCCKYKISVCFLSIDIFQSVCIFKRLIGEKRSQIYLYINKKTKTSKKVNVLLTLKKKRLIYMYISVSLNFFPVKGFFKKSYIFLFCFFKKLYNIKLENYKISYFIKKNFEFQYIYFNPSNFIFLENAYSDINANNYSRINQMLLWTIKCISRVTVEEQKATNFFTNFENFILITQYLSHFSNKILSKIRYNVLINSEIMFHSVKIKKKKLNSEWLKNSLFLNNKFTKYYYSKINISFNSLDINISIYDATLQNRILNHTIKGQLKNEEFIYFPKIEEVD